MPCLLLKTKVDVSKGHTCQAKCRLPRETKVDVSKCHACHAKRTLSIGNWSYSIKSMVFLLTLNFLKIIEMFNKIPFCFFQHTVPYWTNIWVFQLIFGSCKKGKYIENLIGIWIENLIDFAGVLKTIYAMSAGWHVICRYLENISHECWWMVLFQLSAQATFPHS